MILKHKTDSEAVLGVRSYAPSLQISGFQGISDFCARDALL